jgi:hypothetical protein
MELHFTYRRGTQIRSHTFINYGFAEAEASTINQRYLDEGFRVVRVEDNLPPLSAEAYAEARHFGCAA